MDDVEDFKPGWHVKIDGLVNRLDLNGSIGKVLTGSTASRVAVLVNNERCAIKPRNLMLIDTLVDGATTLGALLTSARLLFYEGNGDGVQVLSADASIEVRARPNR